MLALIYGMDKQQICSMFHDTVNSITKILLRRMNICVCMYISPHTCITESLCCTVEVNIVKQLYFNFFKNLKTREFLPVRIRIKRDKHNNFHLTEN